MRSFAIALVFAVMGISRSGEPAVKELPAELVAAWEKAGAQRGWMAVDSRSGRPTLVGGGDEEKGTVPAFVLLDGAGGLARLPQPQSPFGLRFFRARAPADTKIPPSPAVTDAGLKELAGLKNLQSLDLFDTEVTDAGLKELAGLPNLKSLVLPSMITDAGLKELAALKSLQALAVVVGSKVTGAGLKELTALKNLQSLSIRIAPVSEAHLKELAGLKSLRALYLNGTPITDAGLKGLAGLKNLQTLSLAETQVTDAGLKDLAGLKSLQRLYLNGTQVTDAKVAELQKALPSLKIEQKEPLLPPPSRDYSELRGLLKERHSTLSKLVDILTAQYTAGLVDIGRVGQAERDCLKAAIDLAESPENHLAALRQAQDLAKKVVQIAESRHETGRGSLADVLQARAVLLEARIELLRAEVHSQPGKAEKQR